MERTRVKVYQRPNVLPLSLAAFFNDTGADMLFAFYPMFLVLVVGVTDMRLFGIIETIALLFGLLIRPFTGFLADKRGRRHFIWIGYLFLAGSRALQSIAQLWWHIVPPKIMYEVGRALRNPPREALLAESVSQDERGLAFGILGSMDTLGAVIGPLLGIGAFHMFVGMGIDPAVAIRHVLLIAALPTFISVFIILTKTREVRTFATTRRASDGNPHQSTQRNASGFQHILRYRNLLMFTAISCLFSLWAATENFMMVCGFRVLGIDKTSLAQVWVMVLLYWFINITFAPTALISGKLSDKYGRKMQLVLGLITLSFLTVCFAFARTHWQIGTLFALHGIYQGLFKPSQKAFVADLAPEEIRATIMGTYSMAVGIAAIPAPFIFGLIWEASGGWKLPFIISGALVGLCAIALMVFVKERKADELP